MADFLRFLRPQLIVAISSGVVSIVVIAYLADDQARNLGFSDAIEMRRAEKAGIVNAPLWRQKLADEERAKAQLSEDRENEANARAKAEAKHRRDLQMRAVTALAESSGKTDVKITSMGEARAAIKTWFDFERAGREVMTDAPTDSEIKAINAAQAKIRQLKRVTFPRARRAFEKIAGEKSWIDEYVVKVSGKRAQLIQFDHKRFAANKNAVSAHEAILPTLMEFRFKKACYAAARRRTCYDIKSLDDEI